MSPYSVKVRSYFRYKAIPHQWVLRNAESQAEFEKYARMPIIPLVVTPEGTGIQDSTPIIDAMEKLFPEPSIHPDDPVARFISALIEEFGDEWGNKWMFHYRWARDVDQISLGRAHRADARARGRRGEARGVRRPGPRPHGRSGLVRRLQRRDRAADRGRFSRHAGTAGRASGDAALSVRRDGRRWRFRPVGTDLRNVDRSDRGRPDRRQRAACAGLGASHAVAEGGRRVRGLAVAGADPDADPDRSRSERSSCPGPAPTRRRWPRSQEEFSVTLGDKVWTQKPQKYHARSLAMLRAKYADVADKAALDPVLEEAGCLAGLRG